MLRTRYICALLGFMAFTCVNAQQGLNNLWLGGFEDESPEPWGGVDLDFATGGLVISQADREIDFKRTSANITNSDGNLLFSTNGAYIANATGDTMFNGTGLNPSDYTATYPEGLHIPQGCLILPKPEAPGICYLFHSTVDDLTDYFAQYLYLTTIDMSLDGGLGGVVNKNQVLIEDELNLGKITAVRHANGRDWWVFCHKQDTNIYYRLLVTPSGISDLDEQAIGITRYDGGGQVCFSPDGTKFAYYWGLDEDLEIFDFDRCTGLLSDPVHILIDDANNQGGVAFSPNGRFLYVSSLEDVYQFDTEAADIAGSMVLIAHWDGFYSPSPPFATLFDIAQLAPDGKIYIGTGNGTLHLHVINDPDQPGVACNMVQHGIELPRYFMNSLPNHPNYHLGPVDGSVCDSLGINTGLHNEQQVIVLQAWPNPSDGCFTLNYPVRSEVGELEVRDVTGRLVLRERISQWSQVHRVELAEATGLYHVTLSWGNSRGSLTVLVE